MKGREGGDIDQRQKTKPASEAKLGVDGARGTRRKGRERGEREGSMTEEKGRMGMVGQEGEREPRPRSARENRD